MNDMTQPTALEALAAGEAAAAEAGPGEVGVTTVSCDVACVGVFFDGTNNSRDHVGMEDIGWH